MRKNTIIVLMVLLIFLVSCGSEKGEKAELPYIEENVKIKVDGGEIAGIITIPKDKDNMPVVLIVPGSGAVPKDGFVNELKQLSTSLANNDIATLRYDKRGIYDSSNIKFEEKDVRVNRYVSDIEVILKYLKGDSRFSKVFLLGHSQGGHFGAIAIKRESVDGFISLAAPGRAIDEILIEQINNNKANTKEIIEESTDIIQSLKDGEKVEDMSDVLKPLFRRDIQNYMIDWMKLDPVKDYSAISKTPTVIIQGKNDIQISVKDAENLSKSIPEAKLFMIENMSHVLKDVKSKDDMKEQMEIYKDPDIPINTELVDIIVDFVNE